MANFSETGFYSRVRADLAGFYCNTLPTLLSVSNSVCYVSQEVCAPVALVSESLRSCTSVRGHSCHFSGNTLVVSCHKWTAK